MLFIVVGSTFMFLTDDCRNTCVYKICLYVLSIVHAKTLLTTRSEKGGYFKLFLPVIEFYNVCFTNFNNIY